MSYDVVALVAQEPDALVLARALHSAGPDLLVRSLEGGAVVQLRDAQRQVLLTAEPAQLVEDRDEVARLLGSDAALGLPETCWWVELRARPDAEGRRVAHSVADALATASGSSVWTSGRAEFGLWTETSHPAVETVAEEAFVVAQDREVASLSSWLTDAVSAHGAQGHALQLLTPAEARITYPLRTLLAQPLARWVVRALDGSHFDGISGLPLTWHPRHAYIPVPPAESAPEPAPGFLDDSPMGAQLVLDLSVTHRASFAPPLGRAAEILAEHLAGAHPTGWGPHEPALAAWSRERLVRLARHRAPRASVFHFNGGHGGGTAFSGSIRVGWEGERSEERISVAFGYGDRSELPLQVLPALVEGLAAEGLLSVLHVRRSRGRADTTYEPRWHGLATAVGMALGPDAFTRAGEEYLLSGPLKGTVLGRGADRALWYRVPEEAPAQLRSAAVEAQLRHLAAAPGTGS
ncbi:DUF6177 family protein [Nocardiopsis algeriensis]|uniref:Uncharacterized protein n=1 Tax=Nocardiopsis algeriensis TaxID=1478215 RepID=A0A841IQ79_9ACTN|nr:DUF6177 family protein [Nocardiopsis algeriensis]MBB6120272.1 hypothetical protein [Nocardiopsis algeriensis]